MSVDQVSLQDAKDIINLKPEFTPEEQAVAEKLRPQLKALLRPEVRLELEVDYIKKQKAFEEATVATSQEAVKTAIQNWKEDQEPLTNSEIQTLLSQDYIEFQVPIKLRDGRIVEFNLVELPQEIELKFVGTLKKKFMPIMKTLTTSEFKLELNSSAMEKLQSILDAVPEVLDVFVELVAICLNPWGEITDKGKPIDAKWVKQNIGTNRILAVMLGQLEVGRYRDFFLNGFRLSKSLKQSR